MSSLGLPLDFIDNLIGYAHDFIAGYWPIILLFIGVIIAFLAGDFIIGLFADWIAGRQEDFEAEQSLIKSIERQIEMEMLREIISSTSLGLEITARAEERARRAAERISGRPLDRIGQPL